MPSDIELKEIYNIVVVPSFRKEKDFNEFLGKLAWYFAPVAPRLNRIYFNCNSPKIEQTQPAWLDSNILGKMKRISEKITFYKPEEFDSIIHKKKPFIILKWNNRRKTYIDRLLGSSLSIFDVDDKNQRYATSNFLRASFQLTRNREALQKKYKNRFKQLLNTQGNSKLFLLGTGPSLEHYEEFSFENTTVIACNSIVKNRAILTHSKPKIIVAADPVFHAGPSAYAKSFRNDLKSYLKTNPDCYFIAPFAHHHIYESFFADLPDSQLVFIPIEQKNKINLSIDDDFRLEPTDNVLTLFLLPLACTLSMDISLIGFDGNKRKPLFYFWKHSESSQYTNLISTSKKAHPSFFKRSFSKYYKTHTDQLTIYIDEIRKKGIQITSRTKSYIPAISNL